MKGKAGQIGDITDHFSIVLRSDRMGSVFDKGQMVAIADFTNSPVIHRRSCVIHRHDRPGSIRDFALDLFRIDLVGLCIHIRKDRSGSAVNRTVSAGGKGKGRRNDLVSRPDSRCQSCYMKRRRSVADHRCVFCPRQLAEILL